MCICGMLEDTRKKHVLINALRKFYNPPSSNASSLLHSLEVRRTKARNRVPALSSVPARVRNDRTTVGGTAKPGVAIASCASANGDIV